MDRPARTVPPVITAVYQLTSGGVLRPYVVGGVSVLFAYDAHVTNPILTAAHQPDMSIQAPNLPLFDTVEVGTAKAAVWVNPFIMQAGVVVDF
jgi:hypothetical protein